MIDMMSHIHSY